MKFSTFYLLFATALVCSAIDLPPPAVNTVAFDSTVAVWSGHTTVRERVDAGVNERIELWNRTWIVSPSGQTYANTDHWGFNAPDGYSATTITLNETGRWFYWASDGGSIDSFVYGDTFSDWYLWPHNAPNGVGYGGWGRRITAYLDVQPAPPANVAPTVSWNSTPGGVGSGQSYTISAHGHDSDGNLTQVNVWKNGVPFAFAGGGNGTDNDSANPTSDTGPTTVTFTAQAVDASGATSATISQTVTVSALNAAPTITWNSTPGTVASGQSYTVSAHAHDADGNLTQVNVWKNGSPFAFAGGGNGTDNDSGNPTSDTGPATITFTAQAVDSSGATSATITQTVTVAAANNAPTIAWTSTPGTVANGQSYTVSAHGHDQDGNLAQVNVWKNGTPFAFAGGVNGTDGDSGNPTSDTGPTTVTFTAQAVDSNGATSATISQTVTVGAPNNAPTAAISGSTALLVNEVGSWNFSASDADSNLSQWRFYASTNGNPQWSSASGSFVSGSYSTSFPTPGSYVWNVDVQDSAGASGTASITVNVTAPPPVSGSITASPTSATAPGSTTISWSTSNATSVSVSGNGVSSSATSGNQTVNGLPAGTYTYTLTAQGTGGPVTQSATFTVNAAASVGASISASPTNTTAPGASTITWSSANATSVSISGTGLSSTVASGSQQMSGLLAGTYNYTITAQGPNGPATQTATVTVTASSNSAPTIGWNTTPGTVASGQGYTISAHGHDADGNLTSVNVWRNGVPYAFAGGGNGIDNDSGNSSTDTGPLTITYSAESVDASGVHSGTISQTVTISAPAGVAATISASPTSTAAPGSTTITWSSSNATAVSVSGNGVSSSATSGSQTVNALAAGTYTYTLTAQGSGGPVTQTATFTVSAVASVNASISASPTNATAPGASTISWSSTNATSVSVSGTGLNSTAANGSQAVSGLPAGTHNYVVTAQGPNGPATQTATVTVTAAPNSAPTIAWNTTPGTVASGQNYTISAHGHDADGNLTNVNVWRNGVPYAFAGGGNGSDNDSGDPSTDTGPLTITYTAEAIDGAGIHSATISQTVTITAPPSVSGSISANPTSATAPGSTTISWSTSNATTVSVTGSGVNSTATSGSQIVSGLAAGTYTYTLTAQGNGGPITRTTTFTVNSGASVTGSISVSPTTMAWGGTATLTWSTANATSVSVTGYGITGSPYQNYSSLTVNVGGLNPGQTTWTLIADGPGGPITRTATITVTTSDGLYGSITASPTVIYSNQSTTLNWTTTGTSFRWVHGYTPGMNGVNVYPAGVTGSAAVSGLAPGNYRFTIEYGPGSSTTRQSFADLTVLGVNRTVTTSVAPAGTGAVSGAGTYVEGSGATLTATPDATHVFSGWSGDLSGATNPLTFTVGAQNYNVVANFSLRTYAVTASVSPAGTGSVSGAGSYSIGATATLTATPDATHVFTGWSGDITSSANPVSFAVNNTTNVTANFAASSFTLTTSASAGGSVTPGGTYAAGTTVTISASADPTHRFTGWSGDATGAVPTVAVTLDRAKFAQANFTGKTSQTILFDPPGDQGMATPPFTLTASATSGLPVSFSLLGGPAILTGNSVQVTGAGPVTLQANQPGDAFFLPAPPANQTFNVIAAATLKYRGQSRTLLRDGTTREAPPYVLEKP